MRDPVSHRPVIRITLTPEVAGALEFVLARVGGMGRARGFMSCLLDDLRDVHESGPIRVTTRSPWPNQRVHDVLYIYDADVEGGAPKID